MADSIGIGVVGSGFMGRTWAEVSSRHATGTHLVAVSGGKRAPALASDYGVPLEPTTEALLARPDIDAVVFATPPAGHIEQAKLAAAAGKHILVEKPMAQTVDECKAMVAAARAADVRLGVVSHHRFRTVPVATHDAIVRGDIGQVRMVGTIGAEVGWWDLAARGDEWKLDPAQQTAYASWAAHVCDLIRWFTGSEAVRASAQITNFSGVPPKVGQSAMALYTMASGALVQVWLSYEFPEPGMKTGWTWHIVGANGILELDPYHEVTLAAGESRTQLAQQPDFDPLDANDPIRLRAYAGQLEDLVAAIAEHREPYSSGLDGTNVIAMIQAAELAAAEDRVVEIDPDGTLR
ncbi:MAG: Gfo/Idh/MocA family oxidoreductase [Chloroflexota bacterium]